ncbi:outer membrane beta-barrel protein [Kordia sp. YSTF-M3]|uniref:Outer membrane beta-barrel protein n=1 Tax=Kordia aestuariivivens TaxID=2759037 RepID=A0ABR7Q6V0_9FLAO|nr:outer membrane beta-barrel protein [Kordia aestuariivivens]MBC8754284.1 outer membrane beta-barrel protein [Kordia aestuariivivens]
MKKITLFLCILTVAFVNAQDDTTSDKLTFAKGSQFINANLSLNISNSDLEAQTQTQESKNFGFTINSSYAYAISDNLFLGLGLGYANSTRENELNGALDNEAKTNSFEIFPYVRYYKGIGKKLAFFVQGETRYTNSNTEVNNADIANTDTFFFGIRPGLTLLLNKNLALETSIGALGYTTSTSENESNASETSFNNFNLSLNSSNLFFGLSYYF